MDYQNEYIKNNPDLHIKDTDDKVRMIELLLSKFNIKFNSILDVACGSGRILLDIASKYKVGNICGVDTSENMISIAKINDINKKASWIISDLLNFNSKNYDLILAIDIIEHIKEDRTALEKIKNLGKFFVIKVPIEDNFINKIVKILSFGSINEWKFTEKKYGHIHHYSEREFIDLIKNLDYIVLGKEYAHLPKRSKIFWEVMRILTLPLWFLSKKVYLKINGGFLVLLLENKKAV